jgi:NAD(P)-dependent dehydrogenase (short-subunit alcohol dehydrogenase family)
MKGSQDKVAVVTDGGSGIGHAIAIRLAEDGVRVAINDVGRRIADPLGTPALAEASAG